MLKVTPEQLNALSGSVHRTASDVGNSHSSLRSQLTPLFGVDWSGQAAAQFSALYNDFDAAARKMNDSLSGIGQLLLIAGRNYDDAERQIAASFRS